MELVRERRKVKDVGTISIVVTFEICCTENYGHRWKGLWHQGEVLLRWKILNMVTGARRRDCKRVILEQITVDGTVHKKGCLSQEDRLYSNGDKKEDYMVWIEVVW